MKRISIGPYPVAAMEQPAALLFALVMVTGRVWALSSPWALGFIAAALPGAVRVLLAPGGEIIIPRPEDDGLAAALEARRCAPATFDLALLRGPDESASAHVRRMRAIAARPATFRTAPFDREQLWCVLEEPRTPAAARASAAIALAAPFREGELARARAVLSEVASPGALTACIAGDEAALTRAIGYL